MTPHSVHPPHKRVLVIDGGGFRGLSCLLIIDDIMKAVSSRARKPLLPCEVFDLISGTSAGGLIAILLGRLGLDCPTAIRIYKDIVKSVCGSDENVFWERILSSADTGLDTKQFEGVLARIVREYTGLAETPMKFSEDGLDVLTHKSTRAFITVTSEAPTYNNRIYCIRSYPTQSRGSPPNHNWLIQEAARGTVASRFFMPPLFIQKYSFRDAGFAGFNSPVIPTDMEIKELWPQEEIGIVISIGSGLSGLCPPNVGAVTAQYATPIADKIMSKLPAKMSPPSDEIRQNALDLVKQFVTLAMETEVSQLEAASRFSSKDVYVRLDPNLDNETDLVDCFHVDEIENRVKHWLASEGRTFVSDVASKLVELNEAPIDVQTARQVAPPRPSNTNPGYNPQLDERRPDTMVHYLRAYHVYFIIDDSGSMQGSRWNETRDALKGISEHALEQKTNQIDMRFLNSSLKYHGITSSKQITDIFNGIKPTGYTPTGATLKKVLDDHIIKLDKAVGTPEYSTIRPLDIIVLTDGVPTDHPKDVLVAAVAQMKTAKHHPNSIGIQIVQIGNEPDAAEALKELMFGDVGSMVDTVPYDGVFTSKKLERILLGGLHPNVRAMLSI